MDQRRGVARDGSRLGLNRAAQQHEQDGGRSRPSKRNGATVPGNDPIAAFEALVAAIDYPMYIVTTAAEDDRAGCLVGFATQCSLDPPRFLACISKRNHTFRIAQRSEVLVIHFLTNDDFELARLFGENTSDEVDKFAGCRWEAGAGGAPVLADCRGWVAGRVLDRVDLGDHVGFVVEPTDAGLNARAGRQLGFQEARHLQPGHEG